MNQRVRMAVALAGCLVALASTGAAANFQGKLSLRVSGGLGRLGLGELNNYFNDRNAYYREAAPLFGHRFIGGLEPPHWGPDTTGEVLWRLSDRFSLGVGVGFLQTQKESRYEIRWIGNENVFQLETWNLKFSAVPLSLNAYYSIPLSARLSVYLKGGLSYYFAYGRAEKSIDGLEAVEMSQIKIKDQYMGIQAGTGVLFRLTGRIGLLIEAAAKSVHLKNWNGDALVRDGRMGAAASITGSLWSVDSFNPITNKYYQVLTFWGQEPEASAEQRNIHKSAINFSGISIRAGIEVRFGK